MKRTTIYLDAELEILLKRESRRRGAPMAELVREAVRHYFGDGPSAAPPGEGAFDSGHTDTGERAEELLAESAFGDDG